MKALLAGLIGASVAAAIWFTCEHLMQANLGWFSCLVGIATGYSVHRAADANSKGNFAHGALAVVITLVAIVGGRQMFVKVLEVTSGPAAETLIAPSITEVEINDSQAEAPVASETKSTQSATPQREPVSGESSVANTKIDLKSSMSQWDMLWMCLAALAAYVLGKGRDSTAQPEETVDQSEPEVANA